MSIDRAEAEHIANLAAQGAVEGVFLKLGVDISDKDQVAALKDNMGFLARVNAGAKVVKSTTIRTATGSAIAGFIALLVLGFKDWIWK